MEMNKKTIDIVKSVTNIDTLKLHIRSDIPIENLINKITCVCNLVDGISYTMDDNITYHDLWMTGYVCITILKPENHNTLKKLSGVFIDNQYDLAIVGYEVSFANDTKVSNTFFNKILISDKCVSVYTKHEFLISILKDKFKYLTQSGIRVVKVSKYLTEYHIDVLTPLTSIDIIDYIISMNTMKKLTYEESDAYAVSRFKLNDVNQGDSDVFEIIGDTDYINTIETMVRNRYSPSDVNIDNIVNNPKLKLGSVNSLLISLEENNNRLFSVVDIFSYVMTLLDPSEIYGVMFVYQQSKVSNPQVKSIEYNGVIVTIEHHKGIVVSAVDVNKWCDYNQYIKLSDNYKVSFFNTTNKNQLVFAGIVELVKQLKDNKE